MAFPTRAYGSTVPNAPVTSRRLGSGFGGNDYTEAGRRYGTYQSSRATQTVQPSGWRSSDSGDLDSSRSRSPAPSTSSTNTSRGGWSEGSSRGVPSPDAGRQYLQLLTQTKPPLLHHRTYQLVVVQHPQTTAEFGQHDMSRLPLAPPLFVRLVIRNSVGAEVAADDELPFLVARVTLHSAGSPHAQDLSSSPNLYGTTISSPTSLRSMDGASGAYFVFPDVGVRRRGRWRLYVSLLRIALVGSTTVFGDGDASSCLAGVWTEPFEVVSAQGYVAPQRTALTRHFQNQGVRMYISNSVIPR